MFDCVSHSVFGAWLLCDNNDMNNYASSVLFIAVSGNIPGYK